MIGPGSDKKLIRGSSGYSSQRMSILHQLFPAQHVYNFSFFLYYFLRTRISNSVHLPRSPSKKTFKQVILIIRLSPPSSPPRDQKDRKKERRQVSFKTDRKGYTTISSPLFLIYHCNQKFSNKVVVSSCQSLNSVHYLAPYKLQANTHMCQVFKFCQVVL